jgi:tetratricopeptide (TPR) repeat protein
MRSGATAGEEARSKAGILALLSCLLLCATFSCTQLAEVDHYWHRLAGDRILEEGRVPRVDDFTYTSQGRDWVDLHWLFQVLLTSVDRAAGWKGLDALKVALIAGGFGLAGLAALRRARPVPVAAVGLLAVLAAQERFTLRPEAASFLLLGALLLVLEIGRERPALLLAVPPLIALWANLHALYFVGLAVVLLTLLADLSSRFRAGGESAPPLRGAAGGMLAIAAAASVPASLLTPYGPGAWTLSRRLLLERIATGNIYGRSIAEFQAPFSGFGVTIAVVAFALLAALLLLVAWPGRGALRPADLLVAGSLLVLALLARRNIPLFALAALPPGAAALDAALRRRPAAPASARRAGRAVAWLTTACALGLCLDVASNRFFARDGTQRYFGSGPAPGFYPAGAAAFVAGRAIEGEILNDMTMGGYLAWRWYPRRRVYIDGRLEVHSPALFAESLALQQDPERFESVVRARGIGAVLWSHRHSLDAAPLLAHLAGSPDWRPIFADLSAVLFVRIREEAAGGDVPPAIDLGAPSLAEEIVRQIRAAAGPEGGGDPLPAWLRRVIPRREVPVPEVGAAMFFAAVNRYDAAERLLREAIALAPRNAVLHYDRALVLARAGREAEAGEALDAALRFDPRQVEAWALRALLDLRAGDEAGALRHWAHAERLGPLPSSSLIERGRLLAGRGEIEAAIDDHREALRREPDRVEARADLALLYHQRGFRDRAWQEIGRALEIAPQGCAPRVAASRIRAAEGDHEAAERGLREVIGDTPGCLEARAALAALLVERGLEEAAARELAEALDRGLDPAVLSVEPRLRMLLDRPGLRERERQAGPGEGPSNDVGE